MNCIDEDLIQTYIDEELPPGEVVMIENHLKQCKACWQPTEAGCTCEEQIESAC